MDLGKGLGHLTYSTLVHQTDNWDQLWKSVNTYLPAVKARVAPHEKFGVCLRTSAPSIELLSTEPGKLADLKQRTGKTVTLGLEPEPRCYLETTDETITYFKNRLFSGETAKRLAQKTGLNEADAAQAMRSYMGVVFDIGHQSVGYEDMPASLQKLVDNGVQIVKLQEAASMHIPDVTQDKVDALQTFAKTIYLSQTCQKKDGKMTWFLNLEDAFEDWSRNPGPREWRTHFLSLIHI